MDKAHLREYYEKEGETQSYVYDRYQHQIRKYWIEKMMDINKDTFLLDVGCGEGMLTIDAAKKVRRAVGLEIAVSKIRKAAESSKFKNIDFVVGDAEKLPFKNNAFDAAICAEVLEHLPNPERALEEISRVTKEQVVVSVPTREVCMHYKIYALFKGMPKNKFSRFGEGHLREYTPEKILDDLKNAGLRPVKIAGTFFLAVPSSILKRIQILKKIYFILDKHFDDKTFFNKHGYHTVIKCLKIKF